ncbi:MAG: hypothetical protein KGI05_01775 [Thaumarchaeota archaeon]|nr:hypothetical protein [Nitrososphaerota archaeon]
MSSFNDTFAQNVTNFSNVITLIPSSILHSPVPSLSPSENQSVVNVALSISELQNWSHDWQYVTMGFGGNNKVGIAGGFAWQYASVVLKAPSNSAPFPCNNDWWATVVVDMTTMKVVQASYPTIESHSCQVITLGGSVGGEIKLSSNTTSIESPLKQFKSGIATNDVKCEQGLQLVSKAEDGSPACVRPDTAYILIHSGWAKEIVTNTSTESSTLNKTTTNELKIDLSNQTYDAGYPVHVTLKGVNQDSTCKIPSISVRDESDQSIVFGPTPDRSYAGSCVDSWPITFYAGLEKNTLITKSTIYSILAILDNKTYQKEFTVIPSLYSNKNITADSTQIMPGYLTFTSCLPVSDVPNNGTLISYTGFDMYRRYLAGPDTGGIPEIDDYLLKPGHTGSFVMQIHQQFSKDANLAGGLYFLSENLLNLDNSTIWNNRPLASEAHPGLVLSYAPSFAKVGPEGYATITASISAQQNATRGTYWLYLPPGICGGDRVLLTIGEQPLAQPPDYIGYDLASHFAQGVGNPAQSDVTFEIINAGIHTFENCSVNYVSNNQTTTIKTFNVIPPGMEYKYHANLTSTSKVNGFLECKNPQITKVYPDVWVDVIPY